MKFKIWIEMQELLRDLPNFLSANEIISKISLEDHDDLFNRFAFAGDDDEKLLDFKYKNAVDRGLRDDIVEKGVQTPLEIHVDKYGDQTLTDGHHRLAVALQHFPNKPLPIKYWTG